MAKSVSFSRFLFIAVIICVSALVANDLRAQADELGWPEWQHVGGDFGSSTAIYFIDPLHGVAAANGGIYHTYIDQHQWRRSTTPAGIGFVGTIRLIQGKLYASSKGSDVLVSTDSGQSWQYSGLSLANANDVYADGSGNIRALSDPMTRFARIDTLHCVATGNGSIYVSSDGGLNWNSVINGIDPSIAGAFGDPCMHTFVCPSPNKYDLLRSTDSGQTWQSVPTGSYAFPQFIYGASTTVYASDLYGMYRSIDDGVTWTQIITVTGGPHVMYVWGQMGEHAALSYHGGIWMTTTGGDDNLHGGVAMADSNGMPLLQDDTFSVPLKVVSNCDNFSIRIDLEGDVPDLLEKVSIKTSNHPEDFALTGIDTVTLQPHHKEWFPLVYDPHHSIDTVVLQFDNHWHCSDWSETRTVIVYSYPTAQIVPPPPLAGSCKPASEAAFFVLDSCQQLVIDSIFYPPSFAPYLHLDRPLPDTIFKGFNDSVFFTFDPPDSFATILDSVEIFAHFPDMDSALYWWDWRGIVDTELPPFRSLTGIDQFMPIKLIALPQVALYSADSVLSFQRNQFCEKSLDTTVTFTNKGCTWDTIWQVRLRGTGYSSNAFSIPILVPPDSSISIALSFNAPDTGSFQGSLEVLAVSGQTRSISIPLSSIGYPHRGILSMPVTSIEAGSFSICTGDTNITDTLLNVGCDTLRISNMSFVGDTDFTITTSRADSLIPPGTMLIVNTHFKPLAKGPRSASINFHSANIKGSDPGLDKTLSLTGTGLRGIATLAANTPSIDIGQTHICEERDTSIIIQNTGCDTVCVNDISLPSSSFVIRSGGGSFCLLPGESDTISLHTQADTSGGTLANNATITITSDAENSLAPITLTREYIYPSPWTLSISPPDSCYAGESIVYKIFQHGTLAASVTTVDMEVVFNDDMLLLNSIDEPTVKWSRLNRDATGNAHYLLHITAGSTDSILATLHLSAYVTRVASTPLTLDSVIINSTDTLPSDCITQLSISPPSSLFTTRYNCDGPLLAEFLGGSLIIDAIEPNPATDEVKISYTNQSKEAISATLTIEDILGRTLIQKAIELTIGSGSSVMLPISDLPSGAYLIRLSSVEFQASRNFIKE